MSNNLDILKKLIDYIFNSQSSSDSLIVISANIEGLTTNKASILSELCKDKHYHCLCLQETHRAKDRGRPDIPGMTLVVERPHKKHVFVNNGVKFNIISVCEEDNVEFITVEQPGRLSESCLTTLPFQACLVNANQVARQLLINGQGTMPTKPKRPILPPIQEGTPTMAHPFIEEEYIKGIAALKNNKAAGIYDVLVEKLKHLGLKDNKWLHTMLNVCFTGNRTWGESQDYRHIQARERLSDSKQLQTNIPLMPYVQTIRTNDSKQNGTIS